MTTHPLVSAGTLAQRIADDAVTVLDVRWSLGGPPGAQEYAAGHIPAAVFVDLDAELSGAPGAGGRHPLPDAEAITAAMRAKGVRAARPVVVYDAAAAMAAARAWWLLRYFGHQHVAVLDGGVAAWRAAGYELTAAVPAVAPGDFVAAPGHLPVIDASRAARIAAGGVLLDARAPERFEGRHEPIDPVAGHIPGARNHPATENVDAEGRFLDAGELRRRVATRGVAEGVEVGVYCGSGVTAAQGVLALELAGYRAALYAGSWSEWVTDPGRPVARGA